VVVYKLLINPYQPDKRLPYLCPMVWRLSIGSRPAVCMCAPRDVNVRARHDRSKCNDLLFQADIHSLGGVGKLACPQAD
jgi:hypothetical protein